MLPCCSDRATFKPLCEDKKHKPLRLREAAGLPTQALNASLRLGPSHRAAPQCESEFLRGEGSRTPPSLAHLLPQNGSLIAQTPNMLIRGSRTSGRFLAEHQDGPAQLCGASQGTYCARVMLSQTWDTAPMEDFEPYLGKELVRIRMLIKMRCGLSDICSSEAPLIEVGSIVQLCLYSKHLSSAHCNP